MTLAFELKRIFASTMNLYPCGGFGRNGVTLSMLRWIELEEFGGSEIETVPGQNPMSAVTWEDVIGIAEAVPLLFTISVGEEDEALMVGTSMNCRCSGSPCGRRGDRRHI